MKLGSILACIAAFFVAFAAADDPKQTVTVYTPLGDIKGYVGEQGNIFRGIPYAEPTEGKNRFAPPVPRGKFRFPFEAFEDGAGCPQDCVLPPHTCPETVSEACLFLNVFTPKDITPRANLPVMVYFHGGNYKQGTAGGPLYNGTAIASLGDVIVVAVNYRLGSLGFLALPELGINGNFGILDQQLALRWVRSYIGNFGGDGARITIFGQSAGAGSVATHLISPYAKDLFANALLLSNPFSIPFRNKVSMAAIAKIFVNEAGCSGAADIAACLRIKTWKELVDAQVRTESNLKHTSDSFLHAFLPWTPVVDGDVVPAQPIHAFELGLARAVPTIIGSVADEAVPFIYEAAKEPVNKLKYAAFVGVIFGLSRVEKILKKYPATSDTDNREQLVAAGNDFIFQCSARNATNTLDLWQRQDVWSYVYDHALSFGPDAWGPDYPRCYDRVCHAAELPIMWFSAHWLFDYTAEETKLAKAFIQYITNFAHTGNPNKGPAAAVAGAGASLFSVGVSDAVAAAIAPLVGGAAGNKQAPVHVEWTPYRDDTRSVIYFTTEKVAENVPMWHEDTCSFWDATGYVWVD